MSNILEKITQYGIKTSFIYLLGEFYNRLWMGKFRHSFSQKGEDIVIDSLLGNRRRGFYVDIGAYDPHRFSNTKRFYLKGWHGINVEPDENNFQKFLRERKSDINICVGIGIKDTISTFYKFSPSALSTFSTSEAKKYLIIGYKLIEKKKLKIVTLASLLNKYAKNQEIDFLSVDTEGYDLDVLKGNNWKKFRPKVICVEAIEHKVNNKNVMKNLIIKKYLENQGYVEYLENNLNYVFLDKEKFISLDNKRLMFKKDSAYNYLCCPICNSDLNYFNEYLRCSRCKKNYAIEDSIICFLFNLSDDLKLSIKKWDEYYKNRTKDKSYYSDYKEYIDSYHEDIYKQVTSVRPKKKNSYLEIGCGQFFLGQAMADKYKLVIGIDLSVPGLLIAKKMLDEKGIKNYLLIQGDILQMPIKSNVIDLIYGGGVIEHFKDTQTSLNELYRVLSKGGISFNTVPYLSIGSLTYRQVWGNIPNLPIVKQIAEFFHIKLLRSRHMKFGYELSFLGSTLKKIHRKAGFTKTQVERFHIKLTFDYLPKISRRPFIWLATHSRFFWPMVKAIAVK